MSGATSEEQMIKIIGHHLPYEIQMMRFLLRELTSGNYSAGLHNANIESFTTHVRNIFEFLKNKGLQEIEWVISATSERWKHACEDLEPQVFLVA